MLPAISDFLKGTFDEGLKKVLQPSALVPAAIFLLLNALGIFPPLATHFPELQAFTPTNFDAALKLDIWQAVVATAIVLLLSYLLASLSGAILKAMTGEAWGLSLFGEVLAWAQVLRLRIISERLEQKGIERWDAIKRKSESAPKKDMAWRETVLKRNTNFSSVTGYVVPTTLGNVMNATSSYVWTHYHMDMTALFPHLVNAMTADTALKARMDDEKANLDFLLNLSFVLVLVAAEFGLVTLWLGPVDWPHAIVPLVSLGLAWGVYRAAVEKARSWGDVVQSAFDLHREDLRKSLRIREFKSLKDEREIWEKVSGWLLWNNTPKDVFETKTDTPVTTVSCIHSPNVQISLDNTIAIKQFPDPESKPPTARIQYSAAPTSVEWKKYSNYTFLITNVEKEDSDESPEPQGMQAPKKDATQSAANEAKKAPKHDSEDGSISDAKGVFLLVNDSQIPSISTPVQVARLKEWGKELKLRRLDTGVKKSKHKLLWSIANVPANGSRLLHYRLPVATVFRATLKAPTSSNKDYTISGQNGASGFEGVSLYWVEVTITRGNTLQNCTIEVMDPNIPLTTLLEGKVYIEDKTHTGAVSLEWNDDGSHSWMISGLKLGPNEKLRLTCNPVVE